ncbi:phytoene desaturase [Pelagirhabdus alkalitolerans]|uniref:Phytoene desaturase n=1 Tax=Pelagirhabdus alkalitolerans TaxID=1612202 RepID=A0A1G6JN74_9BACI|nr:phytoene desaturase family protein [Pelagirhabdus alkalitolerans]SDC20111.1 phytoene desaturase [Pelagirhabdus alkalitolerans]
MSIAIVGGGIGGLTSAILLRKKGYDVTIYEKEDRLGGRMTYETDGEHVIDQGPTIVLLPNLLREILAECGLNQDDVELIRCDPLYDIHYADGTTYRKHQDPKKQAEEIKRLFPEDEEGFNRYLSEMERIYNFGTKAFLSQSFSLKREFLSFENLKFVISSRSYQTVTRYLSRHFHHLKLRQAYALQTLYIGGAPHQVPALYGLISYSEHAFGIWYVKGGYYQLIPKLEALAEDLGVTIYKNTPISEIKVEDKQVKSLITSGQKEVLYDRIVFNGDYPLIENLIKTEKVVKKKLKPSSGCVMVYLGLNKRYLNTLTHQFFLSRDFEQYMKQVTSSNTLPKDPSCYVFNPVTIDPESAKSNKSTLYLLIPVSSQLDCDQNTLEQFVDQQIKWIEKEAFPGLTEHIEWKSIRTPRDAESEGLFGGGSFGAAPHLNQLGAFRPQLTHPSIKGLYAVGASVHPGGGIPIVMQGARLLVNEIVKGE